MTPGHYTSPLIFTNATTGRGTTTITRVFDVLLPAPTMQPEPPVTGGLFNTVAWLPVAGATSYEAQAATFADFTGAQSSGFIAGLTNTFGPLLDGQLYHYRVRSGALLPSLNGWTQSTPVDLATGTVANVTPDATGITLTNTPGGPIAGRIVNDSFENGTATTTNQSGTIDGWTKDSSTVRMATVLGISGSTTLPLPSSGTRYLFLFSYDFPFDSIPHTAGSYGRVTQNVDFTGTTTLVFDSNLTSYSGSTWSGVAKAEVRIDGIAVWSKSAGGAYTNQSINVSGYTGVHALEVREEILTAGNHNSQWALFDNLRVNGLGGYAASGTLISPTITATPARWGQLFFETDKPAGTTLTVDVLDANNALLAAYLANGADLGAIPALAGRPALRLRANFGTTSTTATPRLRKWDVTWASSTDTKPTGGAWSNVVTSTQDATAPGLTVTSANTSALAWHVITGSASDASGIGSITINGVPAESSDGFAHWNSPPLHLTAGPNAFTIAIADCAAPANTATIPWSVSFAPTGGDSDGDGLPDAWEIAHGLDPADDGFNSPRQGPAGDLDGDGLPNLAELALGLDPAAPNPEALPSVVIEKNPGDNRNYLVFTFRRPRGSSPFSFAPEVCDSLRGSWSAAPSLFLELSATPVGDGLTEAAKVRILPALDAPGGTPRFTRLRVSLP